MTIRSASGQPTTLLTPAQMKQADEATGRLGVPIADLASAAARAIVDEIVGDRGESGPVAVLVGGGFNGTDGRLAACLLRERGIEVEVFASVPENERERDLGQFRPERFALVIDALLGAGLSRSVEGEIAEVIRRLNASRVEVLAVDLPSGIDGTTGAVRGVAVQARRTVTFERRKPGHLLLPGRDHCGRTVVRPIGLPSEALAGLPKDLHANEPVLWHEHLLTAARIGHKYDRGHAVVMSGGSAHTGAARLAAGAALRGGAGLVTLLSPSSALLVNASHLTAIMLRRCEDETDLSPILENERFNAFVLGPGFGVGAKANAFVARIRQADRRLVLDADGITSFRDDPASLFAMAQQQDKSPGIVLTPHEGEFSRLFPDLAKDAGSKIDRAREAAQRSGAIVVLKGADTVIASPDERAAVNATGTAWLATAGTGDVLAGLVAAQLANGLPAFEAACAAVWIHGRASEMHGPGLISEDLPGLVPAVLRELFPG